MTNETSQNPREIMERYLFLVEHGLSGDIYDLGDGELDRKLFFLIMGDLIDRVDPLYICFCPLPEGQRTRVDLSLKEPDYDKSSRPENNSHLLTLKLERGESSERFIREHLDYAPMELCRQFVHTDGSVASTYKWRER